MSTYQAPELTEVRVDGTTRAVFLARATLAAGALLGTSALSPFVSGALAQGARGDVDILNYALTLEHLESAFYERAARQVPDLSDDVKDLVDELAANESAHVKALREAIRALEGKPVSAPKVEFGGAFADEATFLRFANVFEDTGVSAYNGAAPRIEAKAVLESAGAIVQVEARHAALIRLERGRPPAPRAFDESSSMAEVLKAVGPFVGS